MLPPDATYFRYLPVRPEGRAWGAYVLDAGFTRVPPGFPYPPGGHPPDHHFTWESGRTLTSYQFIYITRGRGVFESAAGGTRLLRSGDLFVLFPGAWHRYRPDERTGWDEYWVEFDGDHARRLMDHPAFSASRPVLRLGYGVALRQLFVETVEAIRQEPAGCPFLLGAQVGRLIAVTLSALARKIAEDRPRDEAIDAAATRMRDGDTHARLPLETLAAELHLSYSSFRRRFKCRTGVPPRQFVLRTCLEHAKELLLHTDKPIYLVAAETGFGSVYYFSRLFKRKVGVAPTAFRHAGRLTPVTRAGGLPQGKRL